jgi:phosphonate transport system substrate-binding protein
MRFRSLSVLALFCSLAVGASACSTERPAAAAAEKIVIAIQPTSTPETLAAESREIEQFLEARMQNVDIEIRVPTMYAGVVEALRFGNAHAAFMSAWPAAMANKHAGAEVVLAEVREVVIGEEKVERPFYYSYWVVPTGSPYQSLAELKGRDVAFPSPLSTSGYVFPVARLVELGLVTKQGDTVNPDAYFDDVLFAGGYPQAWEAVKQNQAQVSVIAGDVPEKLYRDVLASSRVIEQQGPIPSHAVVFAKELAEPRRDELKAALLELAKPEHRPLMRKFISGIFVGFQETTTAEHLKSLAGALDASGLAFTERMR